MINLTRRRFLVGLGGLAALVAAPSLVRASSIMPVRALPPSAGVPVVDMAVAGGERTVTITGYRNGVLVQELVRIAGDEGAVTLTEFTEITSIIAEREGVVPDFGYAPTVGEGQQIPYWAIGQLAKEVPGAEAWFIPDTPLVVGDSQIVIAPTAETLRIERRPPPARWPLRMSRRPASAGESIVDPFEGDGLLQGPQYEHEPRFVSRSEPSRLQARFARRVTQ